MVKANHALSNSALVYICLTETTDGHCKGFSAGVFKQTNYVTEKACECLQKINAKSHARKKHLLE